jgi:hypothetical protein
LPDDGSSVSGIFELMSLPIPKLLVVEDDRKTARSLVAGLQAEGCKQSPKFRQLVREKNARPAHN